MVFTRMGLISYDIIYADKDIKKEESAYKALCPYENYSPPPDALS